MIDRTGKGMVEGGSSLTSLRAFIKRVLEVVTHALANTN